MCSDDSAVSKVMPRNRQEDMGFYTQIVTVNSTAFIMFVIRLTKNIISHNMLLYKYNITRPQLGSGKRVFVNVTTLHIIIVPPPPQSLQH